jgi:hypothetical protein
VNKGNEMEKKKVCVNCAHYVKPSLMRRFLMGPQFADRCNHPLASDRITGEPTPCVTFQVMNCVFGSHFEARTP